MGVISPDVATTTTQTGNMTISSFDNARFSMTASQTTEIIPATNEADAGHIIVDVLIGLADTVDVSADSGTNYVSKMTSAGVDTSLGLAGEYVTIEFIGNSTGRYRVVTSVSVGTRQFQRMITTFGELA